jgi:hypothetical protein
MLRVASHAYDCTANVVTWDEDMFDIVSSTLSEEVALKELYRLAQASGVPLVRY